MLAPHLIEATTQLAQMISDTCFYHLRLVGQTLLGDERH